MNDLSSIHTSIYPSIHHPSIHIPTQRVRSIHPTIERSQSSALTIGASTVTCGNPFSCLNNLLQPKSVQCTGGKTEAKGNVFANIVRKSVITVDILHGLERC